MNTFKNAAERIYKKAEEDSRLIKGRSLDELKQIALRQEGVIQTQIGSVAADSEPMSRSAPHTRNSVDHHKKQCRSPFRRDGGSSCR